MIGPAGWSQRLNVVLGAPLDRLEFHHLERLMAEAVREAEDLDFKEALYADTDATKDELAADIASFANHRGGIILLGVAEADGAASGLPGVAVSDGEERRMTQIVAARVTPYVDFRIHRITGPGSLDNGFFALIVPPSASRPHALPRDGRLRFPRRDGTTRRWLAEAEIADLYRDRFRQADDAVSRLTRIIDEALPALAEDAQQPRVVLSLVPTASSDIPNDAKRLQEIETWAGSSSTARSTVFCSTTTRPCALVFAGPGCLTPTTPPHRSGPMQSFTLMEPRRRPPS